MGLGTVASVTGGVALPAGAPLEAKIKRRAPACLAASSIRNVPQALT